MASDLLPYALFGENVSENMIGSKAAKGDDRCGSPPMWKLDQGHHDYNSKQDPAYVSGDWVADNNNDTCCGGHAEALEGDLFPNDKMVMPLFPNEKWKNGESLKGGNLDIPGLGQMGFSMDPRVREMELKTTFASVTDWFDDLAVDSQELEDTTKIERWNRQGDRKYWLAGLWEIDRSYLDNACSSEGEPGDILREDMLFAEWDIPNAFWQRSKDEVQIQRNLECMDYEENANPTVPVDNANQENQKNLSSSWNAVNIMFDLNLSENYREQFKEHREEFETKQMSSLNRMSEGFGDLAHEVVAMEKGMFPLREEEIDILLKLAGDGQQLDHIVDMGTMLEGTNIIPKFINPYTGFLHFVKENSLAQEHEECMKADFVESSKCISGMASIDHSENDVLDKDMEVGVSKNCSDQEASGGLPHEALFYTLAYVSLQDLLSVERVCKSLRVAVKNDVLLWRHLHVEHPLNKKLTNDALLQLSSRAQGHLQCLSLVNCLMITDDGLKLVLDSNPALTKLCLPGCTRITAEGIVQMVKGHTEQKRNGMPGLKHLRIRGLYGLTKDHLDNLKSSMHGGLQQRSESNKPQFYHNGHYSFSYDDDRSIDVEVCPKCENARLVYDCTRERCQQRKDHKLQQCRGCIFCIARCEECGRCIDDNEYEETFCLDLLCSSCWLQLPKCLECNRPGCGRHADHFMRRPDTTFVCGDCRGVSASNLGPEFHGFA